LIKTYRLGVGRNSTPWKDGGRIRRLGSVGNDEHNLADVMGVSEVLLCPYRYL